MSTRSTKSEATLVVKHIRGTDPASFELIGLRDGGISKSLPLPSPFRFPVEGRPKGQLMSELQWYLEDFLEYPFPPETDRSKRVLNALEEWGQQIFSGLFGQSSSGVFEPGTAQDYSQIKIKISSDNPDILAWPWEALRSPEVGPLGPFCEFERALSTLPIINKSPVPLSSEKINILLVIARPYGPNDVEFRSIAKPLIDVIEQYTLPVNVQLLRPPTIAELYAHLRKRPGFYHILHFDGHGSFSPARGEVGISEGILAFESSDGTADLITAEQLSTLLTQCAVPCVVLNACRSAMLDPNAEDAFASVATALLRSGTRSVVAMTHSLYVSGAQKFLPAFYECLFREGNVGSAVRAGRGKCGERTNVFAYGAIILFTTGCYQFFTHRRH